MLALRQRFPDRKKKELKEEILGLLKEVGLDESVYNKLPKELSGGMKQRCAIAQAFSLKPPILLMDEPFGALDAVTRSRLQNLLIDLWSEDDPRKTIFFVTHDVDEALLLANRIVVLGQSPSCVIADRKRELTSIPARENQFSDPGVLELRSELIQAINRDVSSRVAE